MKWKQLCFQLLNICLFCYVPQVISEELEMTLNEMEVYCPVLDKLGCVKRRAKMLELTNELDDNEEIETTDINDRVGDSEEMESVNNDNDTDSDKKKIIDWIILLLKTSMMWILK